MFGDVFGYEHNGHRTAPFGAGCGYHGVDMIRIEPRTRVWRSLAVVTLVGCWACGGAGSSKTEAPSKAEAPRLSQDVLIGKWRLESIEGKPPTSEDIETWTVEFKPDGNWSYTAQMTQRFMRMPLNG